MTTDDLSYLIGTITLAISRASTKAAVETIKSTGKEPSKEDIDALFKKIDKVTRDTFKEKYNID